MLKLKAKLTSVEGSLQGDHDPGHGTEQELTKIHESVMKTPVADLVGLPAPPTQPLHIELNKTDPKLLKNPFEK